MNDNNCKSFGILTKLFYSDKMELKILSNNIHNFLY
jgi:hypothetical protein